MSAPGIAAPAGAQERRPWWRGWLDAIAAYRHPRVLAMLFLGFSAGLPFMLVFTTLSAWLRELGIDRTTIGMLSWVGLAYTLKFFWAPVVDRLRLPVLGRLLGRRRSWMLLAQIGIAIGLVNIAHTTPVGHLGALAGFALLVAFSSATQDIAIDAWRIEAAPQPMQGVMAAAYQLGYRIAIMVASAGALWIAADHGFSAAYIAMAAMVGIGIVTTLLIPEPEPRAPASAIAQEQRVVAWLERNAHLPAFSAGHRGMVHRRRGLPVRGLLHALRHEARAPHPRICRELPAHGLHDGRDGEPVLHRRRLHAQGNCRGRQGLRPDLFDRGRPGRRRRRGAARDRALAGAGQSCS